MTFQIVTEPIDHWPAENTRQRKAPQFKANYEETIELLTRELDMLGTKGRAVIQVVTRNGATDLRRDGLLRAQARIEALRRVDRYGITRTGEQYRGWQQLEAGPTKLTTEQAWQVLRTHSGAGPEVVSAPQLYRAAKAATHPDHNGGLRGPWDDVERAAKTLGLI